jgi:hypothetical protein
MSLRPPLHTQRTGHEAMYVVEQMVQQVVQQVVQ